jgi:hypothetical protein
MPCGYFSSNEDEDEGVDPDIRTDLPMILVSRFNDAPVPVDAAHTPGACSLLGNRSFRAALEYAIRRVL